MDLGNNDIKTRRMEKSAIKLQEDSLEYSPSKREFVTRRFGPKDINARDPEVDDRMKVDVGQFLPDGNTGDNQDYDDKRINGAFNYKLQVQGQQDIFSDEFYHVFDKLIDTMNVNDLGGNKSNTDTNNKDDIYYTECLNKMTSKYEELQEDFQKELKIRKRLENDLESSTAFFQND